MPKESSLIISTSPSRTTPMRGCSPGLLMMKPPRRAATSRALRQPSMAFSLGGDVAEQGAALQFFQIHCEAPPVTGWMFDSSVNYFLL